ALTEQGVASQALGMHPGQYGLAITYIAQGQHKMFFAGGRIKKNMNRENRPGGGQLAGCNVIQLVTHRAGADSADVIVFRHGRFSAWCKRHKENLEIQNKPWPAYDSPGMRDNAASQYD